MGNWTVVAGFYAVVLWKVLQTQQIFLWQTWGTVLHQVFQHSFMLSPVFRTKRSSLSYRNGLPISSSTADSDVTSFINVAWTPGTRMLFMVMVLAVFLLWSRGIILEFDDHPCYFGTSHHPTPESWRIVGKTYCTIGSFDDNIFLLLTLVNGHGREFRYICLVPLGHLDVYGRSASCLECVQVATFYGVCKHPRDNFRQWLHTELKVNFVNVSNNIQQHDHFQWKCFELKFKLNTCAHI